MPHLLVVNNAALLTHKIPIVASLIFTLVRPHMVSDNRYTGSTETNTKLHSNGYIGRYKKCDIIWGRPIYHYEATSLVGDRMIVRVKLIR